MNCLNILAIATIFYLGIFSTVESRKSSPAFNYRKNLLSRKIVFAGFKDCSRQSKPCINRGGGCIKFIQQKNPTIYFQECDDFDKRLCSRQNCGCCISCEKNPLKFSCTQVKGKCKRRCDKNELVVWDGCDSERCVCCYTPPPPPANQTTTTGSTTTTSGCTTPTTDTTSSLVPTTPPSPTPSTDTDFTITDTSTTSNSTTTSTIPTTHHSPTPSYDVNSTITASPTPSKTTTTHTSTIDTTIPSNSSSTFTSTASTAITTTSDVETSTPLTATNASTNLPTIGDFPTANYSSPN